MGKYKYAIVRQFKNHQLIAGICDTADEAFDKIDEFYDRNPKSKVVWFVKRLRIFDDNNDIKERLNGENIGN